MRLMRQSLLKCFGLVNSYSQNGSAFVTRRAPPNGQDPGGGIEIVVTEEAVSPSSPLSL